MYVQTSIKLYCPACIWWNSTSCVSNMNSDVADLDLIPKDRQKTMLQPNHYLRAPRETRRGSPSQFIGPSSVPMSLVGLKLYFNSILQVPSWELTYVTYLLPRHFWRCSFLEGIISKYVLSTVWLVHNWCNLWTTSWCCCTTPFDAC